MFNFKSHKKNPSHAECAKFAKQAIAKIEMEETFKKQVLGTAFVTGALALGAYLIHKFNSKL